MLALADPAPTPDADAKPANTAAPAQPEPAQPEPTQRRALPCYDLSHRPLALTPADLDGDGRDELLVLQRGALLALRPDGARFERYARLDLQTRPRRTRGIARRPTGALAATDLDGDAKEEVALMTSDLQSGSIVYWTGLRFHEVGTIEDLPVGLAALDGVPTLFLGSLQPGTSRFGTAYLRPVQREERDAQDLATPSLALAAQRDLSHLAALTPEGELVIWGRDGVTIGREPAAGSAFAVVELDGAPALPELVLTDPALAAQPDRVRVRTLGDAQKTLWDSGPIEGAVVAVSAGAFRGKDQPSVVFAVAGTNEADGVQLWEVVW